MMDVRQKEFLLGLAAYRGIFGFLAGIFALLGLAVMVYALVKRTAEMQSRQRTEATDAELKNLDYNKVKKEKKAEILRRLIAADGVDPGPNSYLVIMDGGRERYIRTFTIATMPKRTNFADTFSGLFDFPNCTSSVKVRPISESSISHKMDRQINVLGAEYVAAEGDPNRTRKIRNQFQEVNAWAEEIESGENKFFSVGFVFSIMADTLSELNKASDTFHAKALAKSITVTNCYAVQAEAYAANAPCGDYISIGSAFIKADAVNYFDMDKYSVSTIFNYTQTSFTHKDGIPLGRDMSTGDPVMFDLFDESHDGYTLTIAGKTGSGKSATIKMFASRAVLYGYRFVCIDSQQRKGTNEGEFAGIAELCNGINYKVTNDSAGNSDILNPFEIGETTKYIKTGTSQVKEIKTVELNEKIGLVVNTLMTMIQEDKSFSSLESKIPVVSICTGIVTNLYADFGIYEGKPESLYMEGKSVVEGMVTTGLVKKPMPTMSDFYRRLLVTAKNDPDRSLEKFYKIIMQALREYVKELYYSAETLTFFTREEYQKLPLRGAGESMRIWVNANRVTEDVICIRGTRAYYDGQSTVMEAQDCPFTNIDISLLPEKEKVIARHIAFDFVLEMYIKKNSLSIGNASRLVAIFDECHENFALEYTRKTLDSTVRTVRKRNAGLILSTQTLAEYDVYPETRAILKQATAKFVFKQDYIDRNYLINDIHFTESQADFILNSIGGNASDADDKNRHRGEMAIMDNRQVCFCKVDYLKETEKYAVETDAKEIQKMFSIAS